MKQNHTIVGSNKSIITCIGIGLASSIVISLVCTIGLSSLIQKGKINEDGGLAILIIRTISAAAGCLFATSLYKKKTLPIIGAVCGGYFIVLLAVGLVFLDGSLYKVWQGILSVVVGAVIACLIKLKPQKTGRKALRRSK